MENKGRVFIYTILGCRHCLQAKRSLQKLQIPFVDVDIEQYPQCKLEMFSKTSKKSVPQIFFNNVHIGGAEDLQKLVSSLLPRSSILLKLVTNLSEFCFNII